MAYMTNFEKLAILQSTRELLLDALEEKFRVVPEEVQGKLQEIEEREVLRQLHRQAIHASSMEEFLKLMRK